MKEKENLQELTSGQLMEHNGGGFAYDVGRIIRFFGISAAQPIGILIATADWNMNAVVNEIENP